MCASQLLLAANRDGLIFPSSKTLPKLANDERNMYIFKSRNLVYERLECKLFSANPLYIGFRLFQPTKCVITKA